MARGGSANAVCTSGVSRSSAEIRTARPTVRTSRGSRPCCASRKVRTDSARSRGCDRESSTVPPAHRTATSATTASGTPSTPRGGDLPLGEHRLLRDSDLRAHRHPQSELHGPVLRPRTSLPDSGVHRPTASTRAASGTAAGVIGGDHELGAGPVTTIGSSSSSAARAVRRSGRRRSPPNAQGRCRAATPARAERARSRGARALTSRR